MPSIGDAKLSGADGGTNKSAVTVDRIQPAYAQVATQLRNLVMTGKLRPGDQLPAENELAAGFGVSRSTLREALRSLAAQNLVHTTRGVTGGTFISYVDQNAVREYLENSLGLLSRSDGVTVSELLETRASLEVPAARWAALRRTEEQLEGLRASAFHAEKDAPARFEKNQDFHIFILQASGNRLMELVGLPIFDVLRTRFTRDAMPTTYANAVDSDHQEIFQHVKAGDSKAAGEAMREHLHRLAATYDSIDQA